MTMQALPVRGALTLRPGGDIWHKPALSVVITLAIPEVALLLAGRLDLAFYVAAGGLCALYAHGLPYAARARTLVWVVLGMLASMPSTPASGRNGGPTPACGPSRLARRCCRSRAGSRSAGPSPGGPRWRWVSTVRTGRW
ncbi:hypothetical protein [Actinacidiphila soli]|uniref:hypothetical protein n=1 Tax=Actinacidiphila soli TaxID=2487275 RepID=UPI0019D30DF2|nr:hypothetical protein [Actinacidiphila soli]